MAPKQQKIAGKLRTRTRTCLYSSAAEVLFRVRALRISIERYDVPSCGKGGAARVNRVTLYLLKGLEVVECFPGSGTVLWRCSVCYGMCVCGYRRERDPACESYHDCLLYFKGFQALQTHRVAHWLYKSGRHALAFYLQSQACTKVKHSSAQ